MFGVKMSTGLAIVMTTTLIAAETDELEIIKNGDFANIAPIVKKVDEWTIVNDELPADWVPIYSYAGEAEAEVLSVSGDPSKREIRLKRGAIGQHVKVEPTNCERVMTITLKLHGENEPSCLLRVNGKDCASMKKIKEKPRLYRVLRILKPGESVRRISLWNAGLTNVFVENVSAQLPPLVKDEPESVTIPQEAVTTTAWLKTGKNGLGLTLSFQDGDERKINIYPFSQILPEVEEDGKMTTLNKLLPDSGLNITGLQGELREFIRPNLKLFKPKIRNKYIEKWETLPGASKHRFPLTFVRNGEWLECYVDGQYAGRLAARGGLRKITFSRSLGSEVGDVVTDSAALNKDFLALDIRRLSIGDDSSTKVTLDNSTLPAGTPFVVTPEQSVAINKAKDARDRYDGGHRAREYLKRNAFFNADDSALFSVPSAQYTRAWVLCAAETAPNKDTALTARLTRFVSGRWGGRARESLADTTIELPRADEKPSEGIKRVGEASLDGETVPLWLVEIPLKSGDIPEIIFHEKGEKQVKSSGGGTYGNLVTFENGKTQRGVLNFGPYLDFELTGRLFSYAHPLGDFRYLPDPSKPNGVHVFAVTLEKTPVEMEIKQSQPGNIFHNDEKPELTILLRPRIGGDYQLRWRVFDVDGEQVGEGEKNLALKTDEGEKSIPVSLEQPLKGWYKITIELLKGQRQLLEHNASFALLGEDTRQAGYESPFATWWFAKAHFGTPDVSIAGPLILKAGFRRANAPRNRSEAEFAPWKFTLGSIGWPKNLVEHGSDEKLKSHVEEIIKRFPHVDNAMIFHETAAGIPYDQAPELIDLKPEKEAPGADKRFKLAMRYAKTLRDNFPNIKIFIGNSLACTELIAEMLRRGFPEKYADYVGNESVTRNWVPEKLGVNSMQANWLLREIPRKFGYQNWNVTGCFESNYRQNRLIGEQLQAEWYVRDGLLGLAYGCPYISLGLIYDEGNGYQGSFWGDVAVCQRYPLLYPHKSYVAIATLTKILDRAKKTRVVPTGSNSVYALEFSRPDDKWVYAIWTSRGTCELEVKFDERAPVEICDLYGRSHEAALTNAGVLKVKATTAAQYLLSSARVDSITRGARTYPDDPPPEETTIVNRMDDLDQWRLVEGEDPLLEWNEFPPYRTAGKFTLREVDDAEKGKCLELELSPRNKKLPALMNEYAVIRLKEPITLDGEPTTLGLWVKGNSGWGQVYWETEDADGVRRISCGATQHKADVFDYHGSVSINFDGWNFLRMPITEKSPIRDLSTGNVANLWNKAETDRGEAVKYPLKITGVALSLPPQALHLTEMRDIKQIVRLKELRAF